jgi:hypothetical protein
MALLGVSAPLLKVLSALLPSPSRSWRCKQQKQQKQQQFSSKPYDVKRAGDVQTECVGK